MFISIANAIGVNRASGVKYDSDYQAVLNYATTQGYTLPSASQQIIQNQLVIDLKAGGIWNKLDTFANFATDGSSDFALIDWKRLSLYTAVNSPTFTINQGFKGNGTSSYIDTNFTPSTDGVNYQLDNASRYFYGFDALNGARFEGNLDGINNMRYATFAPGFSNLKINSGANNIMSSAFQYNLTSEMKSIHRTSDTDIMLYNAEVGDSRTLTSVDLPTSNQTLFRVGTNYVSVGSKMYAMGSSLVTENTDFVTAFDTYLNSL
ncbi:putative YapH protein [Flavobacterium phage vB_FspP_elemoF_6-3D]|uniref:Putative YapH protein n=1 Tax=Flavobacterium phage vB_FspP_elemoF_6-3D TaxID=2743826 RepID=A0A7D7IYL0_9CAUD|nr:putative YapH protein [Flavobacterium phage vB_FspP_elemoF_6-3D]QMP85229.1 putative YapH protein [Flavobacterium phage vB_FspP_elemoF_6-3D]